MATRSTIAIHRADDTVKVIYCHWDGYPDNNGRLLIENYNNADKIEQLLELGNLSSLGPEIGVQHEFDCPFEYGTPEASAWYDTKRNMCTFYGRDRGEKFCEAVTYSNYELFLQNAQFEEYNYLFRNGEWYVTGYDYDGVPVEDVL